MNFTGALNFSSNTGEPQLGITTPISDARPLFGKHSQGNAQEILLNGRGFLLADSLSTVINWSDPKEVANKYYEEALTLAQKLLPDFRFTPINSHTFRDESIKEHHWIDGIQYGPCAEFVHNDYADTFSSDQRQIEKSFAKIMGLPTDKRVVCINILRSVRSSSRALSSSNLR